MMSNQLFANAALTLQLRQPLVLGMKPGLWKTRSPACLREMPSVSSRGGGTNRCTGLAGCLGLGPVANQDRKPCYNSRNPEGESRMSTQLLMLVAKQAE